MKPTKEDLLMMHELLTDAFKEINTYKNVDDFKEDCLQNKARINMAGLFLERKGLLDEFIEYETAMINIIQECNEYTRGRNHD